MSGGEFHDEWCPLNGCRCGNCGPCAQMPECPASPPAVAASTGTSEDDFRRLGAAIHRFRCTSPDCRHYDNPLYFTPRDNDAASAVLASDWLAAREAATADRVRRETAEGIADALAAHADQPAQTVYHSEYLAGVAHAARIAREQAR